jgi:nicotinate phosphoribosyltransferase
VESNGRATHDVLGRRDEEPCGRPLLQRVMANGRRCAPAPAALTELRDRARQELDRLPSGARGLAPMDPPYRVMVSPALARERDALESGHGG